MTLSEMSVGAFIYIDGDVVAPCWEPPTGAAISILTKSVTPVPSTAE